MINAHTVFASSLAGIIVLMGGCMSNPDNSPDYGKSTSSLAQQQVLNPQAASMMPEDTIQPVDGGMVEQVITGYRAAALPKADTIQNEIHINVGN